MVYKILEITSAPEYYITKPSFDIATRFTWLDVILQPFLNLFGTVDNGIQIPFIEKKVSNLGVPIEYNASNIVQYRYRISNPRLNTVNSELVYLMSPHLFYGPNAQQDFYYAMFHEIIHWTGPRLGRPVDNNDIMYQLEESIANFGSAFMMEHFGIWGDSSQQKAASYLASININLVRLVDDEFVKGFNKVSETNYTKMEMIHHISSSCAKDASRAALWCIEHMENPRPWWKRLLNIY